MSLPLRRRLSATPNLWHWQDMPACSGYGSNSEHVGRHLQLTSRCWVATQCRAISLDDSLEERGGWTSG